MVAHERGYPLNGSIIKTMKKYLLFVMNVLNKGWEVGLLAIFPFIQQKISLSVFEIGWLSTVFIASQVIATLGSGFLSKYFKSVQIIFISFIASAIAWIALSTASSIYWLIITYLFGGISSGLFEPMANSLIAQLANDKSRGKEIANFGIFGDIGRIGLVAVLTLIIPIASLSTTAIGAGIVSFMVSLSFYVLTKNVVSTIKKTKSISKVTIQNRPFIMTVSSGMLDSFSSSSLYIFLPFMLTQKGINLDSTGWFTTLFFIGYLTGRFVLGRIGDKFGYAKTLIISEILMAVLLILLLISNQLVIIVGILFILGIFTRGTSPVIKAMVANTLPEKEDFDKGYSYYSFSTRCASIVSRPIFGYAGGLLGIGSIFILSSVAALSTVVPAYLYEKYKNQ